MRYVAGSGAGTRTTAHRRSLGPAAEGRLRRIVLTTTLATDSGVAGDNCISRAMKGVMFT